MELQGPGGNSHLTYCTNIHAGESWPEILDSLDAHVPSIKAKIAPDKPFGLGLRLSGIAAQAATEPAAIEAFRARLEELGAYVFTINAFPYGPFHGRRVKEEVYLPDWSAAERLLFTTDSAKFLAAVLPEGLDGSISTVPGAFRPNAEPLGIRSAIIANLADAVAHLVEIERRTGRSIAVALEPEPCCMLETTDEAVAFFEDGLLSPAALERLSGRIGAGRAEAERSIRRHLGVCYDVCHGSVEFEDPVEAIDRLTGAGIAVPKIQLSAAMRVPEMRGELIETLRRYDEGVYLHQTVVRNGEGLHRFLDLPDALAAFERGEAEGEWRIHCHVPVFLDDLGALDSTQDDLLAVLGVIKERKLSSHLEVETYTWDVLPAELRIGSKADHIARELEFVLSKAVP
jgi:sugar phosphate isomerase/epimerase